MYLDTLKVSTLEQTAEQTTANGGKGNPDLITWDYGKEISLSLEDALYTPASQSLMWGGKFGIRKPKIQGMWNPRVYPKDEYGRTQYLTKEVTDVKPTENTQEWIEFICPCDGKTKYARFIPYNANYKYDELQSAGYLCPKGYVTGERNSVDDTTAIVVNSYYWNIGPKKNVDYLQNRSRPELAILQLDNYNQFDFTNFSMEVKSGELQKDEEGNDTNVIDLTKDTAKYCIYTPIERCDQINGDLTTACGNRVSAYGYEWKNVDLKMTSLEGEQDMYYLENANLRYRVPINSTQKEIMVARSGFYETAAQIKDNDTGEYRDATYNEATDPSFVWRVTSEKEIDRIINLTRQNSERMSYGYEVNPYDSSISFFLNVRLMLPNANRNNTFERTIRIPLGTFYIIADWNFGNETPYDLINPIESGMENVSVLDRMEKCKATKTFAIDVNKNLTMANYRYMQEYENASLTVFIDPKTMKPYESNSTSFIRENGDIITGNLRIIKQYEVYYKWTRTIAPDYTTLGHKIIVDAEHFPGTYRIVGETYARSRADGKDQRYQFEIPLAKLSSETNLTLQADGDPTTFTMNFNVMRRDDGVMVKLTQYNVDCDYYDGYTSGSTKVVPSDSIEDNDYDILVDTQRKVSVIALAPNSDTVQITSNHNINTQTIKAGLSTDTITKTTQFNVNTLQPTGVSSTIAATEITELQPEEFTAVVENKEVDSE